MVYKTFSYFMLAVVLVLFVYGLLYLAFNFQEAFPKFLVFLILSVVLNIFGIQKKQPKKD